MSRKQTVFLATGTILSFSGIALQLYLTIVNRQVDLLSAITKYISYFTILTNILVFLSFSFQWLLPDSKTGKFFSRYTTTTAVCVYILVVGIIYNIVLRPLWAPKGWDKLADEILHTFVPLYYILYWAFIAQREKIAWKEAINWLIYPILYFIYTLTRGLFTNSYPYPFVDVAQLGYGQTLLNCGLIALFFFGLALGFIAISRARK
jgi:hypothetical protein